MTHLHDNACGIQTLTNELIQEEKREVGPRRDAPRHRIHVHVIGFSDQRLYSHRRLLEACNFDNMKNRDCTIYSDLCSCLTAVTAQLICVFA